MFPDVANLPLRPPPLIAKAAATIDRLIGGRFELGLGAGAFWDAIQALGGPQRTPGESLDALAEAVDIIRRIWSGERGLRVHGRFDRLHGAHGGPEPAHPVSIWLGAYGPRALRLTARVADGWVPSFRGELQPIIDMTARLDDAADGGGRDAAALRRILNVGGTITDGSTEGAFGGPVGQWRDELTDLAVAHGFDTFVLWVEGEDQLRASPSRSFPRCAPR